MCTYIIYNYMYIRNFMNKYIPLSLYHYQLNVLTCSMQCCLPEVGMLPEVSSEGNIPTKGEQHACYMTEH